VGTAAARITATVAKVALTFIRPQGDYAVRLEM
jgi:DUF971 family protein